MWHAFLETIHSEVIHGLALVGWGKVCHRVHAFPSCAECYVTNPDRGEPLLHPKWAEDEPVKKRCETWAGMLGPFKEAPVCYVRTEPIMAGSELYGEQHNRN